MGRGAGRDVGRGFRDERCEPTDVGLETDVGLLMVLVTKV